jgi:hypothetical protein
MLVMHRRKKNANREYEKKVFAKFKRCKLQNCREKTRFSRETATKKNRKRDVHVLYEKMNKTENIEV